MPGAPGEEGDLRRGHAVAAEVIEIEVLQGVGAHEAFRGLPGRARHQFGRDFGGQDVFQQGGGRRVHVAGMGHEADQVLDQRLGDPAIGVVVAHLVADAIGAPAQGQFRQVAGADDEAAIVVGQTEQIVGAQAGLDVLERHVIDRLAPRIGVVEVLQHLLGGRADIDLGGGHAHRAHQGPGVRLCPVRGGEAGQGVGQDVAARQAQLVHRPGRHDQGLGRVEPARNADHQLAQARGLDPPGQALNLDVVGLVAILGQLGRVGRRERKALDRPRQGQVAGGRRHLERRDAERRRGRSFPGRIAEADHPHALLADALDIDIGEGHHRAGRKAPGFGQQGAHLVDVGMAIPGHVG